MRRPPFAPRARTRSTLVALSAVVALGLAHASPAAALNTVVTANGASVGIHDAAAPSLDTGSIRSVTGNANLGFGSLRVRVAGPAAGDPTARLNGEMMRGFGLEFDGVDSFATTSSVTLAGVKMARKIRVSKPDNSVRYVDTFTNVGSTTKSVEVSFGGTLGQTTNSGANSNQGRVIDSGSGDATIGADDGWVEVASPAASAATLTSGPTVNGPSAVVLGSASPFAGALGGTGIHQRNPFDNALPGTGSMEDNFYGFKRSLTLAPGQTRSLVHFYVIGRAESLTGGSPAAGSQITAVRNGATALAAAPSLAGLTTGEICTIANWDISTLVIAGFSFTDCASAKPPEMPAQQPVPAPVTASPYDVVDKTITELQADMEAGRTTSEKITQAYLDRIRAYDTGQFGFHAFISVAQDALEQARAADAARKAGRSGDLLGIPVAVKDLYDTKDLPTTAGSLALEGYRPKSDAFQVGRMRDAGVVVIGKTNLSEFANSGGFSESGYMQTWNAFSPSKTSFGSSGGSGTAVATSMTGFAMGSQTGVSLYAPSTGASLVTMRGTDGISSVGGATPLTFLQDFLGPMARSVSDVARILNITTGTDPNDAYSTYADADAKRPADWKAFLDKNALQGKRIGWLPSAFGAAYGTTASSDAVQAKFADLEALGATMVEMPATPSNAPNRTPTTTGNQRRDEGWKRYFAPNVDVSPFDGSDVLSSPRVLPYNRTSPITPGTGMTNDQILAVMGTRDDNKARWKQWMDDANVDAVVYPGFRSDFFDNDGATLSSDRNTGVPTSNIGLPTIVVPVGVNDHGFPNSIQIVGRAFDDPKVLGFGYALEQRVQGRQVPTTAPKLTYTPGLTPDPIVIEKPIAPVTPAPFEPPTEAAPQPKVVTPATAEQIKVTLPAKTKLSKGRILVKVSNRGTRLVAGTVVLTAKDVVMGRASFRVAGGKSVRVAVKPTSRGKAMLAGRTTMRGSASYTLRNAAGATLAVTKKLSVRL